MKTKQTHQARAFTIIELLTVMSIIVILIGMLVPALNQVRKFSMRVQQAAQLKAISAGLEMWRNDYDNEYPDSRALDVEGELYNGAMKLAEAMMGRDLLGFNPKSRFLKDATTGGTNRLPLYAPDLTESLDINLKKRKGTYVTKDDANAYRLANLYGGSIGNFSDSKDNLYVLCDVIKRNLNKKDGGDNKIGMPILYYKANLAGFLHDPNDSAYPITPSSYGRNYYNYFDNDELVKLKKPDGSTQHTLASDFANNEKDFYDMTLNSQIEIIRRPYREDSFILISAGWDGEYGTADDVTNFDIR